MRPFPSLHRFAFLIALLACVPLHAQHIAVQRPVNLPPPAELQYNIKANQNGLPISGEGSIVFKHDADRYSVSTDTRAMWLGRVLDSKSEGGIDSFGLAPQRFVEHKFRKTATTSEFDRAAGTIHFSDSKHSYPILGGEQDRISVIWQLISVARADPKKFTPGSRWEFFVIGPYDADPWAFRVIDRVTQRTPMGDVPTVHLVKEPPPDSKDQRVDLWLAPSLEWYPVRVRFLDTDGNSIEQFLAKIVKNPS